MFIHLFALLFLSFLDATAQASPAPEPASPLQHTTLTASGASMAVTAHPLASAAARDILRAGGSAVDAAIAAQMVLTLVEPQSSGIGGGGFMLYYDAASNNITSYDGRETAPASATPSLFLKQDGTPMDFMEAARSARSVGVPGLLAMLHMAHKTHGKLPWPTLLEPVIELADTGFSISPRLHTSIAYAAKHNMSKAWKKIYLNAKGHPKEAGSLLKNTALSATMREIAKAGVKAFYTGHIAQRTTAYLNANGGRFTMDDFAEYEARETAPICAPYRRYKICSIGLASSGGIAMLQTLGILQHIALPDTPNAQSIHLIMEAEKIAFADRDRYVADGMQMSPITLLEHDYLKQRADEINLQHASPYPALPGIFSKEYANGLHTDLPSTTHMSIIDSMGNAVSMTSSVEHSFGAGLMVDGFILNNQLTDFSFIPTRDGLKVANAVAPNKRPRSSMTPTMIFDANDRLYAVLGSPGGSSIIGYVTKTIIALLDWNMPLDAAIRYGHFMHNNRDANIEKSHQKHVEELRDRGHNVIVREMTSGINAIVANQEHSYFGVADPRREGMPLAH